ncbi:MAG: hypothetical protein E7Z85_06660 [Methanosphaera stadtmanae]|nr:hypothetical protein [Methanosphaera stadtmanae]
MILKSINLNNYRPYRDNVHFDFAYGKDNVTIILGENDVGKTSLLNAFTWCLYGEETYKDSKGKEKKCNKNAMKELSINDTLEVSVEIIMVDNNNHDVRFIRKQKFQKKDENEFAESHDDFKIFIDDGLNDKQVSHPMDYLDTHLPKQLREHFLFDGEELVGFFKKDSNSVKKAVFKLSQLNLIENMKLHLQKFLADLLAEQKNINPKLGEYQENLNRYTDLKKSLTLKIEENNKFISKLEEQNERLFDEIKNDSDDSKVLIEKQINIENEIEKLEYDLKEQKNNYTKEIVNKFPYIVGNPLLVELNNLCSELEQKGYIPSDYKKEFLEYLLKDNKCICGTKLKENSECYNNIVELIQKTDKVTNISEDVNQMLSTTRNIIKRYPKKFRNVVSTYETNMVKLESKIDYSKAELNEIELKLEGMDVDLINDNNAKINENKILIRNAIEENGKYKDRIKNIPSKINSLKNQIKEEEEKEEEKTRVGKQIDFCTEVYNHCDDLYTELANSIHDQLQHLTSEEFKKIHWRKSYEEIKIDDDFDVSLLKADGSIVSATDPSAASRLVLALSFVIALNSLSGFKLPLIIDSPIGRTDLTMGEKLAEILPDYLENKQITFLVTDREYDGKFKEKIDQYVGYKYTLDVDPENDGETRVIKC